MKTIMIEIPENLPSELAASEEGLAGAFRVAAAIQWYSQGLISQSKGAEIAGLDRRGFLLALGRAKVDALQVTTEELMEEVAHGLQTHRECLAADPSGGSGPDRPSE